MKMSMLVSIALLCTTLSAQEPEENLLPPEEQADSVPAEQAPTKEPEKLNPPAEIAPEPAPAKKKFNFTYANDVSFTKADYLAKGSDRNVRYLSFSAVPNSTLVKWVSAIKYQVPAASRAQLIDRQVPVNVPGTRVFSINLGSLHWAPADWDKVLEKYPYEVYDSANPLLVIRGDWLLHEIADTRDSKAYYLFLYGEKNIPKTDADFLKFWGVDENQQIGQSFGWIENRSQVSLQGTRFIEHWNARGQSLWRTKDMFKLNKLSDPMEYLNGEFKHDGRELIAQISKVSLKKKIRGCAQVYMLANGQGNSVNEAPVRLVEDHKRTLGQTAIVNNASCVSCHEKGMNLPSSNGLVDALEAGDQLYVYSQGKGKQEEIEEFHATDSGGRLYRNNDDFAKFIAACNNLKPEVNARYYKEVLDDYNADLTLERAAGEIYVLPETLRLALAYASKNKILIGSRLVALTRGSTVRRTVWEESYLETKAVVAKWQAVKNE